MVTREVNAAALGRLVGHSLGISDWFEIDQQRVNAFADVTLDHQFVHVDPARASQTPFGGTIAHGFLTLSLLVHLCLDFIPKLAGTTLMVNYGFEKVRFVAPVKVGRRVRARGRLESAEQRKPGQFLLNVAVEVEIENEDKPALVAKWLSLHFVATEPGS